MSRWFRIYDEVLDDPKVQRLQPDLFKAWVNLLCLASRNAGELPPIDDIAFALRVTRDVTRDWLKALLDRGLIDGDLDSENLCPHNWGGRQFRSDHDPTALERQRKKRARDAAYVTRDKPVTSRPPETDTETETDNSEADASLVGGEAPDAGGSTVVDLEQAKIERVKAAKRQALSELGGWWNGVAASLGLPQIDAIKAGSSRESHAWARCREWLGDHDDGLNGMFVQLEARIRGSPFLRGERQWACTFDWIVNATNFQKVLDGNYEDRKAQRG